MRAGIFKNIKWSGRRLLGTAAVGLGLWFGSIAAPGSVVLATDVAVDLSTGEGDGGQQTVQEQPTEQTRDVYLMESYNSEFDLYEESLNNRYFIYMNVSNGGMTSKAVIIDIPANLTYTMEKDGQPIKYSSGTAIQAVGVYVMNLQLDETDGITTTHYKTTIRFRIMEPEAQVQSTQATDAGNGVVFEPGTGGYEVPGLTDEELDEIGRKYDDLSEEEQATLDALFEDNEWLEDELLNPDGTINEDKLNELMAEKLGDIGEIDDIYITDGINEGTGMNSVYDAVSTYYKHTLISGQSFYTDVRNGCITHLSVTLTAADGLDFLIYKDGELYEEENPGRFTEAGSYLLIPVSSDPVYLEVYEDVKPTFSFRIIDHAVNDLALVHAPEGYMLGDIYLDDLPCTTAYKADAHTVLLREDGKYLIEMTDGEVTYEVSYELDRVRPRFFVQVNPNQANIGYVSDDIRRCQIYLNEKPYSDDSIVYTLTDTGKYWFYVFDDAGNYSGEQFVVRYGFNKGAAIAIGLVILAVIGLLAYLRYLNTHVKVR